MTATLRSVIKKLIPNSIIQRKLVHKADRQVLLTFDDGPHPELTPRVLDLLDRFGARACFFVVGKFISSHPELLNEIVRRGHMLGNHTYNHPRGGYSSYRDYYDDIRRCQQLLFDICGAAPKFFRPPLGVINFNGARAALRLKLKTMLWSVEGGEWGDHKAENASTISNRLVNTVATRDILLLHDNNDKVPHILEVLLPSLKSRDIDLKSGLDFF